MTIDKAFAFAEIAHDNQLYGTYPYIYHIKQVVDIAKGLDYELDILIACALHDTIEDTEVSYNDIKTNFNGEIAEIVYSVTDELGRNRKERKSKTYPKIKENWKATVVKICDRIANIEHSRTHNKNLMKMYMKEHKDFSSNIMSDMWYDDDTTRAWSKLNNLIVNIR